VPNLRESCGADADYWQICREERNLAAILYHLLLRPGNLQKFLDLAGYGVPLDDGQAAVYFEYAFLRDIWSSMTLDHADKGGLDGVNARKRRAILDVLRPQKSAWLSSCSVAEFNGHFGAAANSKYIQSPSNWNLSKFAETIGDPQEILRVSKFKWAFNAKPDLVIQPDAGHALCVEAKFESPEGLYPTSGAEKKIFDELHLPRVKQTELQKYLLESLLGLDAEFLMVTSGKKKALVGQKHLSWGQVFSALDVEGESPFVVGWVEAIRAQAAKAPSHAKKQGASQSDGGSEAVRQPGSLLFRNSLKGVDDARRSEMETLCSWAEGLEAKGLCRLVTAHGPRNCVLRLDIPGADHGLAVIQNDGGAPLWLHGTVFSRRAPVAVQQVQALIAPQQLGQRTRVEGSGKALLEAVEAAYAEAAGKRR
jgi:hypothetical protein